MTNHKQKYYKYKQKYLNLKRQNGDVHYFSFRDPKGYPLMQQIIDGTKTVEGRKNSEIYQKVKVGDSIVLKGSSEIVCLVKAIRKYPDIKTYLENEIKNALPTATTVNEGLDVYHTFINDNEISELKNKYGQGFIAFEITYLHKK